MRALMKKYLFGGIYMRGKGISCLSKLLSKVIKNLKVLQMNYLLPSFLTVTDYISQIVSCMCSLYSCLIQAFFTGVLAGNL